MSDLAIMFEETYQAPLQETLVRLRLIASHYGIKYADIVETYYDYINVFQPSRG